LVFDSPGPGVILGVATAAALLAMSVRVHSTILLGFGTAGVFVFVPQVIVEFFGDSIGVPLALFVAGVVMLALALLVARLRLRVSQGARHEAPEPESSNF
jgi:hypothetical protein